MAAKHHGQIVFVPAIRATAAKEIVLILNQRIIHIGQGTMNWLENVSKWIFNYDIQVGKSGWTWKKNSKLLISNKTFFAPGLDSGVSSHYIIYVSVKKELAMFAVVDFDRKETHFFTDFQEASDFITQYPVQETVVVVDLSEGHAVCEQL